MKKYLFVLCAFLMSNVSYAAVENATYPGQYGGGTFDCNAGYYRAGLLKCFKCPDSGTSVAGATSVLDCFTEDGTFSDSIGNGVVVGTDGGKCVYNHDYDAGSYYVYLTSVDSGYSDSLASKITQIGGITGDDLSYVLTNPGGTDDPLGHVAIIDLVSQADAASIVNDLQSYGSTTAAYSVMQGDYGLYLTSAGATKTAVIKAVREISDAGLKEAKEAVDAASESTPQALVVAISEDVARILQAKITDAGGTAIIQAYK